MHVHHDRKILLAPDLLGQKEAGPIAIMHKPSLAFAVAIGNLRKGGAGGDERRVLIRSLASKIAGNCRLKGHQIQNLLMVCISSGIVMDWRISIPGAGLLQALFAVTRFECLEHAEGEFYIALQLAGGIGFDEFPPGPIHMKRTSSL